MPCWRSEDGLTRTEIAELLGRNQPAKRLEESLALLARFGRIYSEEEPPKEGGRKPATRYYAT